jgi:hypothetical protein
MYFKHVVGIDPDVERHGFALYTDGNLVECTTKTTIETVLFASEMRGSFAGVMRGSVLFSIENVMANSFVYSRNQKSTKQAECKVALSIGRNQQAQAELQKWLDYYSIPYVLHKPQAGNWKTDKEAFEKITGWTGRSNDDSRSAAFFGYKALVDMTRGTKNG